MPSENFDVVLRFLMDNENVKREVKETADALGKLESATEDANKTLTDQKEILDDLKTSLKTLRERQKEFVKGSDDYNQLGDEIKKVTQRIAEQTERVKQESKEYGNLRQQMQGVQNQQKKSIELLQKEAAALNSMASLRTKEIADLKERAAWIEKGSTAMLTTGIAGFTAITTLAKSYIDSTEESNELTKAWADSSERVQAAQQRIGKVAAEAVLPLYEKLADIAEKTAAFAEKNPGVLEAGLKASIVLAGLGGIRLLVSKGITLYADIKMIAVGDMQLLAAKLMSDAATKQLAAATGGKVTGVAGTAAGTAAGAGTAGTAGAVAASPALALAVTALALAIGAKIGEFGGQILGKAIYGSQFEANLGNVAQTIYRIFSIPGQLFIQKLHEAGLVSDEFAASVGNFVATVDSGIGSMTGAIQQNSEVTASNAQTQVEAAQAMGLAMQGGARLAVVMNSVERAANGSTQGLGKVPNALFTVANSIIDFIERIVSFGSRTNSRAPSHDYTGYAYTRTYAMAQDGKRQFVMSGDMTRIAEQMLGGQLNQQMVLGAMSRGIGRTSVIWNDHRRFSGEYSSSMSRSVRNDTLKVLGEVFE